jgi:16S rRNA (guanine527-N7)-methyltransferase
MRDGESSSLATLLAAQGVYLPEAALQKLLAFLDELHRWNRQINLTAITGRQDAIEKHLLDSLTVLPLLRGDEELLDLGSGAGLPGIPLKLASPQLSIWSVDAVQKKISFQKQVVRLLSLSGFHPTHARVESLAQDDAWLGRFDVVVARAVASLPTLAGWGLPLLRPSGRLIAMKGPEGEAELASVEKELRLSGAQCTDLRRLRLPVSGAERLLLVFTRG